MNSTTILIVLIVVFLCTGAMTVITVLKTVRASQQTQRERKVILDEGMPAKALIHSIKQTSSSMDDRPGVLLDLTVTQVDGHTFQTTVKTFIPVTSIPQFQAGSIIDVRYKIIGNERKVEVIDAYVPSSV